MGSSVLHNVTSLRDKIQPDRHCPNMNGSDELDCRIGSVSHVVAAKSGYLEQNTEIRRKCLRFRLISRKVSCLSVLEGDKILTGIPASPDNLTCNVQDLFNDEWVRIIKFLVHISDCWSALRCENARILISIYRAWCDQPQLSRRNTKKLVFSRKIIVLRVLHLVG
jgi:hypothetical protein